ncbi:MAG TPA: tricarballylate utilization 4Fe-4S protein TcuB [candidate division Zixibacteria bacterium]|nr:tricarballylate utilization 4Fe-4S protein TcuB [candidate division Zixibacteria bacterium]
MPQADLVKEGARQMTICNACRYCEGYCAVFPAMELRRTFGKADLVYLANLCFDCRDCYYACQYAPPHEFAINIPKLMAELRRETYREFTWPGAFAPLFNRNARAVAAITASALALIAVFVLVFTGPAALFATHLGEGAFYRVVPYAAMTVPPLLVSIYGLAVLVAGALRFWRETAGAPGGSVGPAAFLCAARDALGLVYLRGGGAGCNYPGAGFSASRRWLHHLVFYGFLLDFASTSVAAFYDHFLGWQAPYPFWSWPVVLGTAGGVGLMIGTAGLLYLKWKSDPEPSDRPMVDMDVAFLVLLFLTSVTGMALLAFRETPAMGTLLAIHLGAVAGFFLTLPYGKFAHAVYRYAALIRYAAEEREARREAN